MNFFSYAQKMGFTIPDFASQASCYEGSTCKILDGKKLALHFATQAKDLCVGKKKPCLAVVLVGENPASQIYVKNKIKFFARAGFLSKSICISEQDATEDKLVTLIGQLNVDCDVHGILLQLPLPKGIDNRKILNLIAPHKDVDGFLAPNIGSLALGNFSNAIACTPFGIMVLLAAYGIDPATQHAVVVGRSSIVGKPMGLLLLNANATVTMTHSKTQNLKGICKQADILIVAAGQERMVTQDYVKEGACVVDVGIHKTEDGKLCGDVHESVRSVAGALSPVPGGVGPMTIAMLALNTAVAAWK